MKTVQVNLSDSNVTWCRRCFTAGDRPDPFSTLLYTVLDSQHAVDIGDTRLFATATLRIIDALNPYGLPSVEPTSLLLGSANVQLLRFHRTRRTWPTSQTPGPTVKVDVPHHRFDRHSPSRNATVDLLTVIHQHGAAWRMGQNWTQVAIVTVDEDYLNELVRYDVPVEVIEDMFSEPTSAQLLLDLSMDMSFQEAAEVVAATL